ALRNQMKMPSQTFPVSFNFIMGKLPKMHRPVVKHCMDSIASQTIKMIVGHPMDGIVAKVLSNTIRPFAVKINGIAPRRPIQIGEVGAEFPEIISFRADVVIHHIQHDSNSLGMTGVYQLFQTLRPTVGMLYSIGENAVVTPISTTGKLGHRH